MPIANKNKIFGYYTLWIVLSFLSVKIKELIIDMIKNNATFDIFHPFFSFYEVHNTGAAFNLLTDKSNILVVIAVCFIIIFTVIVLAKTSKLTGLTVSAMAMLSAGMSVNTMERIQDGYVTDYIYFTFFKEFPVFNISDVMIIAGALMLAFSLYEKQRTINDKKICL